jgi:lipopolysaccharide transport system permease protein
MNTYTSSFEPRIPLSFPEFREWWEHRELLFFLTWRDIKVRYKQTLLGMFWAVLQPFLTMLIFTVVLGRLAKMPSNGLPYPLFTYVGLVPWCFFAYGLRQSSVSILGNAHLVRKVYFPRALIPLSAIISGGVDLALTSVPLVGLMAFYKIAPAPTILFLPLFILLCTILTAGVGFWLCALNVHYRDINYLIPFLSQIWFLATPIYFPSSLMPKEWHILYALNPMVGIVEGFRWCLFGMESLVPSITILSCSVSLFIALTGLLYFRRMEKTFADVV